MGQVSKRLFFSFVAAIFYINTFFFLLRKVIVWKEFQKAYVLEGHEAAVWAVLPVDDDTILTASADKMIRLWKNGKLVHVYQGHTDAVRGLALVSKDTFVSCSNDG